MALASLPSQQEDLPSALALPWQQSLAEASAAPLVAQQPTCPGALEESSAAAGAADCCAGVAGAAACCACKGSHAASERMESTANIRTFMMNSPQNFGIGQSSGRRVPGGLPLSVRQGKMRLRVAIRCGSYQGCRRRTTKPLVAAPLRARLPEAEEAGPQQWPSSVRQWKPSGRACSVPDSPRLSSNSRPASLAGGSGLGRRAGLAGNVFSRWGSSCGAKGKVQVWGQVKFLPAPQLLLETGGQNTS